MSEVKGTTMNQQRTRLIKIFALSAALALVVAACGNPGAAGEESEKSAAGEGARTEFTIELTEFAYEPSDVTLPAGETVTLTLKNTGTIPHEFMLGTSPQEDGGYGEDLLSELEVEVVGGNGYVTEGLGDHDDGAGPSDHGAMIQVEPGGEITLKLTIPSDAAGSYEMGCFLPGHYEAGMKGTVTIEG